MKTIRIALAGNPNSGKTSVFNAITGSRQRVGNYPGVTVEKKEGVLRKNGYEIHVADLPGIYSLTAYSVEEVVARNHIIDGEPDAVIAIIDSSNLERNLYLAVQLKELGVPLVLSFNMIDVARRRGFDIDLEKLSRRLGAPVVPTVGHKGEGIDELIDTAIEMATHRNGSRNVPLDYGRDVEKEVESVAGLLRTQNDRDDEKRIRWLALKLIEKDKDIRERVGAPDVLALADKSAEHLEALYGEDPEIVIAEGRYNLISAVFREAVRGPERERRTKSERIDAVVTHRLLGIPIFLALMYAIFHLTFTLGETPMDWIEAGFDHLGGIVGSWWAPGAQSPLRSLLVDGVIGGVGGVVVFLPNIVLLFFALSLLESSGYMARAAFIMDRLMNKIGLHGKSFIPMLIGFGCSVPAIMATRTLDNRRDRLTTMLVVPLISCSARLPIYLLIIPAFFPGALRAPVLWAVYVVGILLAVASAKLLRVTVFKGQASPFLMELPPYKVPTLKSALVQMWERSRLFLRKAGTMILGVSIVLWALTTLPAPGESDGADAGSLRIEQSMAGTIGRALEPVIRPMGFDWKIGTALIGALAAKEVFVAQMGIVYSLGETDTESETLRDRLRQDYSPLVAFCIMLFSLVASPCMATVAVTRRESNSWRWALFQFWGLTALAYVLTMAAFQIGSRVFGA